MAAPQGMTGHAHAVHRHTVCCEAGAHGGGVSSSEGGTGSVTMPRPTATLRIGICGTRRPVHPVRPVTSIAIILRCRMTTLGACRREDGVGAAIRVL